MLSSCGVIRAVIAPDLAAAAQASAPACPPPITNTSKGLREEISTYATVERICLWPKSVEPAVSCSRQRTTAQELSLPKEARIWDVVNERHEGISLNVL